MKRRKIVKMVNFGKKLRMRRSETITNSDHAWTYSLILTLTLPWICFIQNNDFKIDQILKKYKLEKWPIGYETAKWSRNDQCWKQTLFYGLRTKRVQIKSYDNLNYQTNILDLFWAKRETTGKRISASEKQFQLKLVKWSKKNAYSCSHLRKINGK